MRLCVYLYAYLHIYLCLVAYKNCMQIFISSMYYTPLTIQINIKEIEINGEWGGLVKGLLVKQGMTQELEMARWPHENDDSQNI